MRSLADDAVDDLLKQQRRGQGKQLREEAGDKNFNKLNLVSRKVGENPMNAEGGLGRVLARFKMQKLRCPRQRCRNLCIGEKTKSLLRMQDRDAPARGTDQQHRDLRPIVCRL